jgi:ubiquinone/menaquinone biosynthesis C-methylase UbiE
MKKTEYDNIDIIGVTHETYKDSAEKLILDYYHKQEVGTVSYLLKKMNLHNFEKVVDLGTSIGVWYNDYKNLTFKKVIGIDISSKRANEAKKRGYDEVHVCNAYDLPFENESQNCMISNDVLVHVLQDSDKLKIFQEARRVLKEGGMLVFNFANAYGFGYKSDTYCGETQRLNIPKTMMKLVNDAGLKVEYVIPSYYTIPRIGANPHLALISSKLIFPLIDSILRSFKNLNLAKVIYLGVRKIN